VAFIGVVSLVGLYRMDAFKTIENNTPEFCETFNMDGSAEDIEIDYERGYAYLSFQDRAALISGENVQGRIVKINLNKSPYVITSALTEQPEHLRPHGISLYIDDNGRRHLAVINHPKNRGTEPENIDLFFRRK
jgi:arylesterase/paraoxonase